MSDAKVRELERRARGGDVEARREWRAALVRLRDPRRLPKAGDVLRLGESVRLVRDLSGGEVIWNKVTWLYGPDHGAGLCYQYRRRQCSVTYWWRWARKAEVVRVAEERHEEPEEE